MSQWGNPYGEVRLFSRMNIHDPEIREQLLRLVPRTGREEGTVWRNTFKACPHCGRLEWGGSSVAKDQEEDSVHIDDQRGGFSDPWVCEDCQFIIQRHPEVGGWVQNVVRKIMDEERRRCVDCGSREAEQHEEKGPFLCPSCHSERLMEQCDRSLREAERFIAR